MLARLFKLFSIVILLTLNFNYQQVHAQSSCTTLSGETGACVPILTCNTITEILKAARKPLPPSVSELVRKSYCGTFNNIHHVCCNDKTVDNTPASTEQPTTSPRSTKLEAVSESRAAIIRRSGDVSERQIQTGMNILDSFKTQCGKSDADKISNGEDANLSEYPWMALLVFSDGVARTLDCGGSLITDRYVLTAAHCIRVPGDFKKLVSVRLGEHDQNTDIDCTGRGTRRKCAPEYQEIDVEEATYHKDFRVYLNDIALIRLVSAAIFRSNVRPICLPITERSMAAVVDRMIIAGWGKIEDGNPSKILQRAVVPVRENKYCDDTIVVVRLAETHLCAGGGDARIDTCLGDSGGPIFYAVPFRKGVRYVQYGIVSAGSERCGLEFPSIFTRVQKFLPWIAGNLNL